MSPAAAPAAGPAVRGWCPGALRPMLSGDGYVLRVRPRLARLAADAVLGLCDAATTHGAGLIDLTNRANLQIRGVAADRVAPLQDRLAALGLLDAEPVHEARRNLLVAPDWRAGDDTQRIAADLLDRLDTLPDLPAKVGFAVDAGPAPILSRDSADFRIERGADGGLILRADGRPAGVAVSAAGAAEALVRLAHWFAETGGTAAGRVARHAAALPVWAAGDAAPAAPRPALAPGPASAGLPFGQIGAAELAALVRDSGATALRLTPWRVLLLEGGAIPDTAAGIVRSPDDRALTVDACAGAPFCPQASVETRALAARLAPHVTGRLHVSGCAKGCARAAAADITLTGRDGRFDLARNARAGDPPVLAGLSAAQVLAQFGAC